MLSPDTLQGYQIPLIHEVSSDDESLLNTIDGEWFPILYHFNWQDYRQVAADYYNALYDFNQQQHLNRPNDEIEPSSSEGDKESAAESPDQARQRHLFNRATAPIPKNPPAPVLYLVNPTDNTNPPQVCACDVAPGVVPLRLLGRKPKCFFGLFKAFVGASLLGMPSEPDAVHLWLKSNPAFARVCGFSLKPKDNPDYRFEQIPSLRKLEQFDQIMREAGLWDQIKHTEVCENLSNGVIAMENEMVGDTTHFHAYSTFETVHFEDEKGKAGKKSQSRLTKNCHCENWESCSHEWILRDEGAGTIVKSASKMYWGHKASIIGLPEQGVIIDAMAISDAATHDGKTFFPHVKKALEDYPTLKESIHRVLYDSACDDANLKQHFKDELELELVASFNPRRSSSVIQGLPRGIEKITPHGAPYCLAGHEFDYQGIRYQSGTFIYHAPKDENGLCVCEGCKKKGACCNRNNSSGRTISIPFETLPHIDQNDPPMGKQFKAILTRRPSVERMIKRLKCDLGDAHLSKRGNDSFQAYLDKTMIAYHLLIRYLY